MRTIVPIARLRPRAWRLLPAAVLACGACAPHGAPTPGGPHQGPGAVRQVRPTPAINLQGRPIDDVRTDTALRRRVLNQAASLHWDTSDFAADRRFLSVGGVAGGPWGEVAPESGSVALERPDVCRGRIVGRIYLRGAYADLGLPAGFTYIWVDSLVAGDSDKVHWRAFLIPERTGSPVVVRRFSPRPYPFPGTVVIARWVGPHPGGEDEQSCVPCDKAWCCP